MIVYMHTNYCHATDLLVVGLRSSLAYFIIDPPQPQIAYVARQLPTNTHTHTHQACMIILTNYYLGTMQGMPCILLDHTVTPRAW